jgi:hypothetical protein
MTNKEKLEVIYICECLNEYTRGVTNHVHKKEHWIKTTHYEQKVKELDVACKALEALAKQSQKYAMFESMRIAQQALNQIKENEDDVQNFLENP